MKPRAAGELLLLAALWGASFLFMRVGAPEFGPLPLVAMRVGGASVLLLALLAWRRELAPLRAHWAPLLVVGLANSALPFVLFSTAALVLDAGLSGILNATAPLWGALIAWAWLGQRPTRTRGLGLLLGFAGVLALSAERARFAPAAQAMSPAWGIAACLLATLLYGFAVNFTQRRLQGVPPLVVAAGSQTAAALLIAAPAAWLWPAVNPSGMAWGAAALLAVLCTGVAYVLFFRLVAQVGPAQAITVTYLIPAFAVAWGVLLLGESVTPAMVLGGAIVLLGTALASGLIGPRARAVNRPARPR